MQDENQLPTTLVDAIRYFADPDVSLAFFVSMRWPDGVVKCPRCESARVNFTTKRRVWTCEDCPKRRQFSIKVGTIMEDSPLTLDKWIIGIWLITSAKNGISSYEIHRAIGITQKSAWFLAHRVRAALQSGSFVKDKLKGLVEVDESYIGGLARNMHKDKKAKKITGTGGSGKTAVQGLLQRHIGKCSKVIAEVVEHTRGELLNANVRKYVLKGTEVHTDALPAYNGLDEDFIHEVIDHAECYVRDGVTTNGLENFWSLLKRGLKGTYVSVEPFHLFRYLSEQVFRFNERKNEDGDLGRFLLAVQNIAGKRLTYAQLTATLGHS